MRLKGWLYSTVLALPLAPLTLQAVASDRMQWKLASFTWVKRVPAEPGAPGNAHPAALTEAALQALLGSVQASVEGKEIPLFAKEELTELAKALREAWSLARPGEDLILLSTHKRGGGILEMGTGLSARLFVREGALNLIVHDARLEFMNRYSADRTLPTFSYGSRTESSAQSLHSPGATNLRGDWLALPLVVAPVAAPVAATAPVAVPAATTPPAPVADPALAVRDAAFFAAQTQRLKALKRLRDENLISEAEYAAKREAILKTL